MPSSGPMILESVRKLGFKPQGITIMINGHAHPGQGGSRPPRRDRIELGDVLLTAYHTPLKDPSYPGIADDYRRTHHFLEMLRPDIWLAQHNEYYDLKSKVERARTDGVKAWVDPQGYRRFIASKKRAFEDQVDKEMGAPANGPH